MQTIFSLIMLHSRIFCLLVSVNIVFFVNCAENSTRNEVVQHDDYGHTRWNDELKDFRSGLTIMSSKGKLVTLTKEDEPPIDFDIFRYREYVKYHLYTRKNPNNYQQLDQGFEKGSRENVSESYYDNRNPTVFITHGWMDDGASPSCTLIRDAYLKNHNVNVIVVDWSFLASGSYLWCARQVKNVGIEIASTINYMMTNHQLEISMTTLVGHSLGAHVMGIAGYENREDIAAIYGLDPAYQLFKYANHRLRISTLDAKYVQIIHTNAGFLGYREPCGHTDIYVNGGIGQSGCSESEHYCSHSRAYEFFAESINTDFWTRTVDQLSNKCLSDPIDMDSFNADRSLNNETYILFATDKSPFAYSYMTNCPNNTMLFRVN